jgi:transposase
MRDKDLYAQILGISSPWSVARVELAHEDGEVRIHIANEQKRLPCPECDRACGRYDSRPRRWRHLDTCQLRTILIADVPRVDCAEHGVRLVRVPWAEEGSAFTALFEALVIDWLLGAANLSVVARRVRLSWRACDTIRARAVRRGQARKQSRLPEHLGVDETSFQKRHEYVTVLVDQVAGTVDHVADGRRREVLDEFYQGFSEEERARVSTISMDMCDAFIAPTLDWIPGAEEKIVFDKFHVAQHLCNAVDKVRRQEHRLLMHQGDESLKGTRYAWLKTSPEDETESREALLAHRGSTLRTARAWALKEFFRSFWSYTTRGRAKRFWQRWHAWAIRCRLQPVVAVARMIQGHLYGLLNAVKTRATNARLEAINSQIQKIKTAACGFRNRQRFRDAIYFHLGGLDLHPESVRS